MRTGFRFNLLLLAGFAVGCGAGPDEGSATTTRPDAEIRADTSGAAGILAEALARQEARMAGIDNYTVVQTVMGIETTAYYEREVVDGRPRFRAQVVSAGGQRVPADPDEWEDLYDAFAAYADRTTLAGSETVDGHRTHVLVVDDFSRIPAVGARSEEMREVEFHRATLHVDAEIFVLRRMVLDGVLRASGSDAPVTVVGRFEDHREVSGMIHPFRTVITAEGMTPDIPAAEVEEARRNLDEMRSRMASMPAAQREMMERMIRPQMEQLEGMLGGGGMEFVTEVREIRVNAGPPSGR
jgi:hypothetical protein